MTPKERADAYHAWYMQESVPSLAVDPAWNRASWQRFSGKGGVYDALLGIFAAADKGNAEALELMTFLLKFRMLYS